MKRLLVILLSVVLVTADPALPARAADDPLPVLDPAAASKVSYRREVAPILRRHCWSCHNPADAQGGLDLTAVATFAAGGQKGVSWIAGKPDQSLVVQMLTGAKKPAMPYKEPPLSAAKIHTLRQWILAGARDDSPPAVAEKVVIPNTYRTAPPITSLAFSPDGKLLATACRSEVVVLTADGSGEPQRLATESDLVTYVGFSPDGKLLASAGGIPGVSGQVRFFELTGGKARLKSAQRLTRDTLFRGGFSPDSKSLALGSAEGTVYVLTVGEVAPARKYDLHSDWVSDVTYSVDGKMLFSVGRDKAVKVSSAEDGKLLRAIASLSDYVNAVDATEGLAIAAGRDRTPTTYTLKQALLGVTLEGSGNGTRPVANAAAYTKRLEGQPGEVLALAVSADRKLLAVGGAYSDVRVYQVVDGKRIALIAGVPQPVYAVALSPDGKCLAVGGASGQIHLHELPGGKRLQQVTPVPVAADKTGDKGK